MVDLAKFGSKCLGVVPSQYNVGSRQVMLSYVETAMAIVGAREHLVQLAWLTPLDLGWSPYGSNNSSDIRDNGHIVRYTAHDVKWFIA